MERNFMKSENQMLGLDFLLCIGTKQCPTAIFFINPVLSIVSFSRSLHRHRRWR